jgi:flagellar assembly factor FliW
MHSLVNGQPSVATKYFGHTTYEPGSEIEFPWGLPAFEDRRKFVAIRFPKTDPLLFLQSLEDPGLCFVTMPALAAEPQYRLRLSAEDLSRLGLPSSRQPRVGQEVQCLVVVAIRETGPTVNLLAPVVINVKNMKAIQAVMPESPYSVRRELSAVEAPLCL